MKWRSFRCVDVYKAGHLFRIGSFTGPVFWYAAECGHYLAGIDAINYINCFVRTVLERYELQAKFHAWLAGVRQEILFLDNLQRCVANIGIQDGLPLIRVAILVAALRCLAPTQGKNLNGSTIAELLTK